MTFLPIVERELRVASRQRITWRGRVFAAGLALVIFLGAQMIAERARGGGFSVGQIEFAVLKWLCFVIAGSIGIFLTADVLSEEKREGTLGLLFLTDLRGYDIVLGKLLSQSLLAFYALLAAFPILGLTMLAGGVTGPEFTRVILVLCNTLFFSLALGMLVSAVSRDSTKAMNGALFLTLLFLPGLPFLDTVLTRFDYSKWRAILSLASPGFLFYKADAYPYKLFWPCLGLQHLLAWIFLAFASFLAPRSWHEKAVAGSGRRTLLQRWRFGGSRARRRFRQKFLEQNPVFWLALRDRWLPRAVLILTAVAVLARTLEMIARYHLLKVQVAQIKAVSSSSSAVYTSASYTNLIMGYEIAAVLASIIGLILYLWLASQACRFFVDARRQGALELILVTPLGPRELVAGAWRALYKTFRFPALYIILSEIASRLLSIWQMQNLNAVNNPVNSSYVGLQTATSVINAIGNLCMLAALGWFGMWMGLTNRKTWVAILKTIGFVVILPAIVLVFLQLAIPMARVLAQATGIGQFASSCVSLAIQIWFILWSRKQLLTRFRDVVTGERRANSRRFLPGRGSVRVPGESVLS